MDNVIRRTRDNDTDPAACQEMPIPPSGEIGTPVPPPPIPSSASPLLELRKARLSRFNSERKFS
jgi:hypothetical protein